jgi:hypothetical protein
MTSVRQIKGIMITVLEMLTNYDTWLFGWNDRQVLSKASRFVGFGVSVHF